jgi:hypothetical protein
VRNIFSCVGSVVTEPLIVAIGNGVFKSISIYTRHMLTTMAYF